MVSVHSIKKAPGSAVRHSIFRFFLDARLNSLRRVFPKAFRTGLRRCLERRFSPEVRFVRTTDWATKPAAAPDQVAGGSYLGSESFALSLNVYGYFSRWFGLGECARLYARVMLSAGWPVSLHDVDINVPHSRRDHTLSGHFERQVESACTLVFVNPDHWQEALRCIERAKGPGENESRRYVIGYWFWELEEFPDAWLAALEQVDEIMVSSAFVERAVRRVCNKPVTLIPLPILADSASALQRRHFGLPDGDTIFFCTFDFNSSVARKNPYAVIEAFREAFPLGDEKVFLLIKSSNGYKQRASLWALMDAAALDDRILVRDDMLERDDLQALHQCIDVHVSMHRAEGFGLGLAEAMYLGKPVIATAYSGNQEFMTASNSCPVKFRMVPVLDGQYPHAKGQQWADPDTADAARWMRELHVDRALAARLGAQAAHDIARRFSAEACAAALSKRLRTIAVERLAVAVESSPYEAARMTAPSLRTALKANEML